MNTSHKQDSAWHDVGAESDFSDNAVHELVVADRIVAIGRDDGALFALDGVCPHQGGPLGKGEVGDCVLTCPWHGWQFDVRDGQSLLSPHVQHPTFEVKTESGRVLVRIPISEES